MGSVAPTSGSSVGTSAANMASISGNVQAMVQATLQSESGPLTLMQQQQASLTAQSTALNTIMSQLTALQTAVNSLADLNGQLSASTVTSSNTAVATATADSTATLASHTLSVTQTAVTSSAFSDSVSGGASATLNDGTLSFTVGGSAKTVAVSAANNNNTLTSLASNINATSGIGVTASVVTDSTGSKLVLVSSTPGATGSITSIGYSASGSGNTTPTFGSGSSNIVAGQDAKYTLDNIPLDSTSNTVTGVLQGVTLNLQGTTGTTTLSISPDTTQASTAITNFVNAYNTVVQSINTQFTYNSGTGSTGPLGSDSSLQMVQQSLLSDATYAVSGNSNNLSSLGITTNEDGTLSFDSATFGSQLTGNPTTVRNFFQQFSPSFGFAQNFANSLVSLTDPANGALAVDLNGITQQQSDLTQQINDFQTNLNAQQQQLVQQYSQANATLLEMPTTLNSISSQLASIP